MKVPRAATVILLALPAVHGRDNLSKQRGLSAKSTKAPSTSKKAKSCSSGEDRTLTCKDMPDFVLESKIVQKTAKCLFFERQKCDRGPGNKCGSSCDVQADAVKDFCYVAIQEGFRDSFCPCGEEDMCSYSGNDGLGNDGLDVQDRMEWCADFTGLNYQDDQSTDCMVNCANFIRCCCAWTNDKCGGGVDGVPYPCAEDDEASCCVDGADFSCHDPIIVAGDP
mmetsp:Transcript_17734/g.19969  ORF Transcript_17734/g.19969 Transcript_17734/m.19969 type:complete len:223 (+) Transcript_17734:317-985(+)|eukprot:CAMPEP_0195266218 /NCGR_PEP_ID=MMETSP0706-20130129/11879_1 /TAXON_ID=33640 /ORGANISM="Asterionellopsis glacialis, Strain CCMP134" /LENGTH=222 /DNA_ID=CAMNT_0040320767 /DNA_START=70 /DNA_END=738 /DNA_ORIENTATION=+